MSKPTVVEGEAEFVVAGVDKPCKTWYKIVGDLNQDRRPLVVLHGGVGLVHDYIISLADLAISHSIPVVFYDQIGNGRSTHLREKNGDTAFWTGQLFRDQLDSLIAHLGIQDDYDMYGHSWGGMLGSWHAEKQPKGLKHLIIANSPASIPLWQEAQLELLKKMPQETQDIVHKHEAAGTTDSPEYEDAMMKYYSRFACQLDPLPEELMACFTWQKEDPTVYNTLNGTAEFNVTGPFKDWSVVDGISNINVPTLLLNGKDDMAIDKVLEPFFLRLDKVKWVKFDKSSHMPHLEERKEFMKVIGRFLTEGY